MQTVSKSASPSRAQSRPKSKDVSNGNQHTVARSVEQDVCLLAG